MEKLTTIVLKNHDQINNESETDPENEDSDWILASIICVGCFLFLIIAIKLCYNYSRKFPASKNDPEELANLNRHGISIKGVRGARYSVA